MQTLLSASMALILLESITKVPDLQVAQTGKSSIFRLSSLLKMGCYITLLGGTTSAWCSTPFLSVFFLLSFLHHDSTITAEAITMIRTLKAKGIFPGVLPYPLLGGPCMRQKGYPPIPVIVRTPRPEGCPPISIIERTLRREVQLPGCPPVLVTGGTLIRKEQQFD